MTDLWDEFKGQKNTDEVLERKAVLLATILVRCSHNMAKQISEKAQESKASQLSEGQLTDEAWETMVESAVFFIHFMDREAFRHLGPERRGSFIDPLMLAIGECLADCYGNDTDAAEFLVGFPDLVDKRQYEYAQYKTLYPEGEDSPFGGSLLWQFSKRIASVFGTDKDIRIVMSTMNYVFVSIKEYALLSLIPDYDA